MGIEYCGYPNTPSSPQTLLIAYSFIIVLTPTAIHTHHTRLFSLFLLHLFRAHSIRPKLCNVRAAHILRLYLLRAMNRRDNACANLIFAWVSKKFRLLTCPLRTAYRFRSAISDHIHRYIYTYSTRRHPNKHIYIHIYSTYIQNSTYIHTVDADLNWNRCQFINLQFSTREDHTSETLQQPANNTHIHTIGNCNINSRGVTGRWDL